MSKQLPMGSLPRDVQQRLESLLQMELNRMTPAEVDFLRSRKDYLSKEQRDYYGLDKPVKNKKEGDEQAMSRQDMIARLKELNVQFKGNASNDTLKELLEEAESGNGEKGEE